MGKSVKAEIVLPHGTSIKVDKLIDRTIRTIRVGDYLPTSLNVRGTECSFYALVYAVEADRALTVFGSTDRAHVVPIPKGSKVDVFRPIQ